MSWKCILLLSFSALLLLFKPVNASISIKINNKPITLNTPIISHKGAQYLPIRDVLYALKGDLIKSRKHHHYILKLPKYRLEATLKPRRNDLSVNGLRHYLPSPILFLEGRLHVPVPSFFNYLGFKVFSTPSKLSIIPKAYKGSTSTAPKTSREMLNKAETLPLMEKDRLLYIAYGKTRSSISSNFFYQKNILFANIIPFFQAMNYAFETTETGFLLTKKHHTIQFFINKNSAKSQFINHQTTIFLSASPIKKKNRYYLPIESTINAFFYAMEWNPRTRTIQLLSIINDIDFITENDRNILQINATHPLTFKNFNRHPWSTGYLLDIPNSKLMLDVTSKKLSHPILQKYTTRQLSPTTTQIKVIGKTNYTRPIVKRNDLGLELNFITALSGLSEKSAGSFTLIGSGPLSPKLTILSKQKKIVIDIPYTLNQLPSKLSARYPGISQIRTSQFKTDPYQSRIVFDLQKSTTTASLEKKGDTVKIQFKEKKKTPPLAQKRKHTHKQRHSQTIKKSHYARSSPLKGKVIIVDAGHGGKDPGAIGLNKYQEKFFTLDIAKRLQKRLAKQGAVVIMTRQKDHYISLKSRAYRANKNKASIFVSIHINSFLKSSVHGTETFYYKYKDRKLAQHIQKQLIKDLKHKDLKTKRARLYVLRHTTMPSVLIEPLFITNPRERKRVLLPKYRQKIANSIYQGIYNYFRYQ